MSQPIPFPVFDLRVVLFEEQGFDTNGWIAECIELPLLAQGNTQQEAQTAFTKVLKTYLHLCEKDGRDPLSSAKSTPATVADHPGYQELLNKLRFHRLEPVAA